jgi:hypothetical protein
MSREVLSGGVVWKSFKTGEEGVALVSTTRPYVIVRPNGQTKTATFTAKVGSIYLGKRYRSEDAALEAAAKHLIQTKAALHVVLENSD